MSDPSTPSSPPALNLPTSESPPSFPSLHFPFRPRGHSTSTLRSSTTVPNPTLSPLSRVTSAPASTGEISTIDIPLSSFPSISDSRSRSPPSHKNKLSDPEFESWKFTSSGAQTPPHGAPSSWWNRTELVPRPWKDSPRRKKSVPLEQTEAWLHTRARVAEAAASVLGTAADVTHELLLVSVDVLRFAPIPGLSEAARTLLSIWDSMQLVDMNRLACLRLTERCAEILLSVREEIADAGDDVGDELKHPLTKLVESFSHVHFFLQQQVHRPFIKRYLKRDEILRQITVCDASLSDSLGLFSLSIQIRILKQVQKAELQRHADTQALLKSIMASGMHPESHPHGDRSLLLGTEPDDLPPSFSDPFASSHPSPPPSYAPIPPALLVPPATETDMDPASIRAALRALHARQNELDQARDTVDLRGLMRVALQASSDAGMISVLQVGRDEMPEAIKTLQRALEREVEKEGAATGEGASPSVGRRVSVKEIPVPVPVPLDEYEGLAYGEEQGDDWRARRVRRRQTIVSIDSVSSSSSGAVRDTLDREFIESGIDALRRVSHGVGVDLPSWTITRYEVDREEKIGIGFFSDVYRGTWRGRTVAIKVLAATTSRQLFVREVCIWKGLQHSNVLELFGASAATGEGPWFFVSPYMRNGSLVSYLKARGGGSRSRSRSRSRLRSGNGSDVGNAGDGKGKEREKERGGDGVNMLKMMHEIARGMEYLHSMGVLHGDLKGANVLVDDKIRCVIADFGQSDMKSEVYRLSGTPPPHGTLRWQAPELMAGQSELTTEIDVYAYAICCVEILTMGNLPWPHMDDDAVRHFVLKEKQRPTIPLTSVSSTGLNELLRVCWHQDPFKRPPFSQVVRDVKQLRLGAGAGRSIDDVTMSPPGGILERLSRVSPDMRPIPLLQTPPFQSVSLVGDISSSSSEESYKTLTAEDPVSPVHDAFILSNLGDVQKVHPVMFVPSLNGSRTSSIFASVTESQSDDGLPMIDYTGYDSPPPANERLAGLRDERRFRMTLAHEFHPSLTLPLWSPTPVALGAVGYLSKPSGTFVTLFNALDPIRTSGGVVKDMPSVYGFGSVTKGNQRQEKRNIAQKGLDAISGFLTFKSKGDGPVSQNVSRRYSFPLRAGHRIAYLYTETTIYRYIQDLEAPKAWFKANVDAILHTYGSQHPIQKEDLFLVIGTLDTPDYALFVSHQHPDGQVHFDVFSHPKTGNEWGMFSTDTDVPAMGGPSYHEEVRGDTRLYASKVSIVGQDWDTVLIARLRFKSDVLEPTSLL